LLISRGVKSWDDKWPMACEGCVTELSEYSVRYYFPAVTKQKQSKILDTVAVSSAGL